MKRRSADSAPVEDTVTRAFVAPRTMTDTIGKADVMVREETFFRPEDPELTAMLGKCAGYLAGSLTLEQLRESLKAP